MEVETETPAPTIPENLVSALEQATLLAKQLRTTTDPTQLHQIHTALRSAHHHLSLFLSTPENFVSSAAGGEGEEIDETGAGEPMQMGDDEDDERNSTATTSAAAAAVEKVAGRMRECFIQNKRPKRQLSPSAAVAEQRRMCENDAAATDEFDFVGTKLRSLELIYQFHA